MPRVLLLLSLLFLLFLPLLSEDEDIKRVSKAVSRIKSLEKRLNSLDEERIKLRDLLNRTPRSDPDWRKAYERYRKVSIEQSRLLREIRSLRSEAIGAVKTVVAMGGKENIIALLKALYRGSGEPDVKIEEAALAALAKTGSKETVGHLIAILEEENDADVLVAVCEVMRRRKEKGASDVLISLLQKNNWEVVVAAAKALSVIRAKRAVVPMIEALARAEKANKAAAARGLLVALQDMTGKYELSSAIDFHNWWNAKGREEFDETKPPPTRSEGKFSGKFQTVLYGNITSKRVIFICDVSGSMAARGRLPDAGGLGKDEKQPETGGGLKPPPERPEFGEGGVPPGFEGMRIEILKLELAYIVNKLLSDDSKFNIIIFSNGAKAWKKSLTRATEKNRESALEFVRNMQPLGGTNIYAALEEAFKDREVDTIYLLSDGNPTVGETTDHKEILAAVRRWNRGRNIIINTIGLLVGSLPRPPMPTPGVSPQEDKEKLIQFLKELAHENGGTARIFIEKGK